MRAAWVRGAILLVAAETVLSLPTVRGQDKRPEGNQARQRFETLLLAAKQQPKRTDWKALRHAFADTAEYNPYSIDWRKQFTEAIGDVKKGDLKTAEKSLVKLLELDRYMRIDAHFGAVDLYEKLKQQDKVALHRAFIEGISSTLFVPGAGLSFEKPIEVLFIDEEYMFLAALGVKAERQGLSRKNGHSCDVYKVKAKDGRPEHMFYFNVDLPQNSLHRRLEDIQDGMRKDRS
jgi:Domain of unknown function (DUF4919)